MQMAHNPTLSYVRLAVVAAGIADGLLFDHLTGVLIALIILGIIELAVIADAHAKR